MKAKSPILLLLLLCGLLYFTRLGAVSFYEEDEPRFAAAVRTMVETGDYLTPRFNGKLRINKPILFYWLASGTSKAVGVGELGARIPSALLGTLLVVLTFLFARAYGGVRFGGIAAFFTATCIQYAVVLGRASTADMTFICFLSAAFYAFFRAYTEPGASDAPAAAATGVPLHPAPRWPLLFWAALALAVLAKGPAGVVLTGGAIGLFLLLRGDFWAGAKRIVTLPGLLLFALIAVPWFAIELHVLGKTFWRGFFIAEHLGRYAGTADPHRGPIWFFLPVGLLMFYPWSLFLPAGLAGIWAERRTVPAPAAPQSAICNPQSAICNPLRLYALCWAAAVFAIFSFSGTKLPHYIAPLYPAAAILAASAWERRLRGEEMPAWRAGAWVMAALGLLLAGGLTFFGLSAQTIEQVSSGMVTGTEPRVVIFGLLLGGAGLVGGALLIARRPAAQALTATGAVLVAALLFGNVVLAPVVARCWQDPIRHLAEDAASRAGEDGQLAIYAMASSVVVYYSKRDVAWVKLQDETYRLEALARKGPLYVITKPSKVELIPAGLGLKELRREGGFLLLGPSGAAAP